MASGRGPVQEVVETTEIASRTTPYISSTWRKQALCSSNFAAPGQTACYFTPHHQRAHFPCFITFQRLQWGYQQVIVINVYLLTPEHQNMIWRPLSFRKIWYFQICNFLHFHKGLLWLGVSCIGYVSLATCKQAEHSKKHWMIPIENAVLESDVIV